MVSLYSGTPGSGKSLHCARTIINWSRFGYPIVGNFQVDLSKYKRADFTYCPNHLMTPKYLIELSQEKVGSKPKEGSILLVIDECQLLFNAREWQQNGRAQWLSFFTQHRKLGYDIILIAQFDRMIDRQIRSLIEYEIIHRKISNFGWQGKILSLVFGGKSFVAVKRWYPLHERLGAEVFHARKWMYSVYDTYAAFDVKPKPAAEPAQVEQLEAAPAPELDTEAKQGEVVDLKLRHRFLSRARILIRPYLKGSLVSRNGKYLRSNKQSQTGWTYV